MNLTHTISALEVLWVALAGAGVWMRGRAVWNAAIDVAVAHHSAASDRDVLIELACASRRSEILGLIVKACFLIAGLLAMLVPPNPAPAGGLTGIGIPVCFVVALVVLDYSSLRTAMTRERLLEHVRESVKRERGMT